MKNTIKHPAKFTDCLLPLMTTYLTDKHKVLDPFAGTGKIGVIKDYGFKGIIYANEIEKEWLEPNEYNCDILTFEDAEFLNFPNNYFDAICTSPTYGNRMADHHKAKDNSIRNTYTHCLGRPLNESNTGKMQWGKEYKAKHEAIYKHLVNLLENNGIFILNIKNHIRKGEEMDVKSFHENILVNLGLDKIEELFIPTTGNRYGANSNLRTNGEYVMIFKK